MKQSTRSAADGVDLRDRIIRSLRAQVFRVRNEAIPLPKELSKERIRELHETAVEHRIERARDGLFRVEKDLLRHIASGHEHCVGGRRSGGEIGQAARIMSLLWGKEVVAAQLPPTFL